MTLYHAFLSYSHEADRERAAALHSALHRFAKPWYRLRALHVFRDQTNLAATPELWPAIQKALDDSEFLLLLASPASAASDWVPLEIEHWCKTKSASNIIVVQTGGTIVWRGNDFEWQETDALPRVMSGRFKSEPYWIDLTWAKTKEELSLRHLRFRDAVASIAAPLHKKKKEVLDGEDVREHRRAMRLVQSTVAVLALLVVLLYVLYRLSDARRRMALSRQLAAQSATLVDDHLDRALLLAVQASRISPTLEARNSLFTALASARYGHAFLYGEEDVNRIAFSRDGKTLAAGTLGGDHVVLWDLEHLSAPPRRIGKAIQGNHFSLAFSPDANLLATATQTGVVFWDAKGAAARRIVVPGGADSLAFSPDGKTIAFVDAAGSLHVGEKTIAANLKQQPIAFSRDGRLLAAASGGGRILLWRLGDLGAQPQVVQTAFMPAANVKHRQPAPTVINVGFAGDGTTLLAGTSDGVRLWTIENDRAVEPADAIRTEAADAPASVYTYALSADGTMLAAGYSDGAVKLWDVVRGTPSRTLTGHADELWTVALSADGSHLAAGYRGGVIRVWDLTGHSLGGIVNEHDAETFIFVPKSKFLVTADLEGVRLRDRRTGALLKNLPGYAASLAADPSGGRVAAGGGDGLVRIWRLPGGELAFPPLAGLARKVTALAFSHDGRLVAAGDEHGSLAVWDVAGPRLTLTKHSSAIESIAFDPNDERVFAATSAGLLMWDRTTGRVERSGLGAGIDATLSADGRFLASADAFENTVWLSDLETRRRIDPPLATVGVINEMAFSGNGQYLAITDGSGSLRLWEVASGQRFGPPLFLRKGAAFRFAFDGAELLAVSEEDTLVMWELHSAAWERRARAIANRNLTREEWQRYIPDDAYEKTFPDVDDGGR